MLYISNIPNYAVYKYLCSIYFLKRKQAEDVQLAALAMSTEKSSFESSTLDWSALVLTSKISLGNPNCGNNCHVANPFARSHGIIEEPLEWRGTPSTAACRYSGQRLEATLPHWGAAIEFAYAAKWANSKRQHAQCAFKVAAKANASNISKSGKEWERVKAGEREWVKVARVRDGEKQGVVSREGEREGNNV